MKRILLIPIMLAALAPLPSSASANYYRHCGNQPQPGAGWYHVRAHEIDCTKARSVARRFSHTFGKHPYGFSCRNRSAGIELERVACRRVLGHRVQKVRFEVGA